MNLDAVYSKLLVKTNAKLVLLVLDGLGDIATGGPGFSFPVSHWNGTTYVNANRTVADSALGDARFIPN